MNADNLYEQRSSFFLAPSPTVRGGLIFCIVIGIVTFIAGLVLGQATRTWGSLLFNLFFFFSLALGGVVLSGIQDTIGALWGRPIMRLHESFASFLPAASALLFLFLMAVYFRIGNAHEVYRWIATPEMLDHFWGKKDWLQPGFMVIRDTVALIVILALANWQLKQKLSRDNAYIEGDRSVALRLGIESRNRLRFWSGPILVVYAVCFTLLAFDLTMSLAPTWFSTLWGGWAFAIMMQTLMAALLIFMFIMRDRGVGRYFGQPQFHDVGKLMHGFTIFFAYLTYAHVLTYWYGNVPEETEYFIHRLHSPWIGFIIALPIMVFVIPLFALIPKASKWTPSVTIPLCILILLSQWLINLLVVIPETIDAHATGWSFPTIELGLFFGVLGLFLTTVFRFGQKYPMLSVGDPLLVQALDSSEHH